MAELLMMVVDKTHSDPSVDPRCFKRGMVICVQPDNWPWGLEELRNPDWRILRVPKADPDDLLGLTAEEPFTDTKNLTPRKRRAFRLDLEAAEIDKAGLREAFNPATPPEPIIAKDGKPLAEIADTVAVVSEVETIVGTNVTKTELITESVKYPIEELDAAVIQKLAGLNVKHTAAETRPFIVVDCPIDLLTAITVQTF